MLVSPLTRILDRIESLGNRIPHPTLLFVYLSIGVVLLSWLAARFGLSATHPVSGTSVEAFSLLSREGLHRIMQNTVSNFTGFAPVGTVLVAMLGIGIADQSGLLAAALRQLVLRAPAGALTFSVVLAGVLSSLAADAGYVVLIPLAGALFLASGRHPLAGIAAAFAGVSAGYSANIAIGPVDAMLAGISTEASALIDSDRQVSPAGNYYFMAASTLLIAGLITWVSERLVSPRLGEYHSTGEQAATPAHLSNEEKRGLKAALGASALFGLLLLWALLPADGVLRGADSTILGGPLLAGIVSLISLYFAIAGASFGYASGTFKSGADLIESMETSMRSMAGYLVLMFFAAQFVSYFAWTELGIISAIHGAQLLQISGANGTVVLMLFVILAASINLLVGSASAKWAIMAPVFVPMFMLYGIEPEATQVAYRIGDSSSNIVTPLMPYFGIVVAFAQQYDRSAGIGTIIALMLPYSLALLLGWSALLALWLLCGWPLGL